ncbi:MAG: hypothetical protein OHK0052_01160 [Anaerolineales bacterium]
MRWSFFGLSLSFAVITNHFVQQALALDVLETSRRWQAIIGLGALLALFWLVLWIVTFTQHAARLHHTLHTLRARLPRTPLLFAAFMLISVTAYLWLITRTYGIYLQPLYVRAVVAFLPMLTSAALLQAARPPLKLAPALAFSALTFGTLYLFGLFFTDISTHPFTLGWSEASRYYYASLFFSDKIYGTHVNPTVLHPTRYLLQAIPFAFDAPLWLHRLWQSILWVTLPSATVYLLVRRLNLTANTHTNILRWSLTFWGILFLFQGPVYYHLFGCLILVVWGFDVRKPARTWGVLLLSSVWAGMSRINWMPMPALTAAALYLLEQPVGAKHWLRYSVPILAYGIVGMATALAAQFGYAVWSGNALEQFGSSFTSDLFWYRLLPNPTYPEGILPAIVIVSLPLWVYWAGYTRRVRLHPIRWLGLGAILAILFAGGLVVSVKIGGGNNLHNLDGYLWIAALLGMYALAGRLTPEGNTPTPQPPRFPHGLLTALGVAIPVVYALLGGGSIEHPSPEKTAKALRMIQEYAENASGPVLFLGERQLVTFGEVPVPLVADYERVFLMEMAMSRNAEYLARFRARLAAHEFAVIVSEPLRVQVKGAAEPFGEENDAWSLAVSQPVLCFYEPVETVRDVQVQILLPRPVPLEGCE